MHGAVKAFIVGSMILAAATLVGLVCLGLWVGHPTEIKKDFDLMGLVQLAVTLFLGGTVAHLVSAKMGETKAEKDVLLELVKSARTRLDEVRGDFGKCAGRAKPEAALFAPRKADENFQALLSRFKGLGTTLTVLDAALRQCDRCQDSENKKAMMRGLSDCRRHATREPYPTPDEEVEAEHSFQALHSRLTLLMIDIIRS